MFVICEICLQVVLAEMGNRQVLQSEYTNKNYCNLSFFDFKYHFS
jgi:hypothetical protein